MAKQRKYYSSEEKVSIRRRRVLEGVAVSTLCNELSLQPTVLWRRLGLDAVGPSHLLAVLMEEYVALKEHAAEVISISG